MGEIRLAVFAFTLAASAAILTWTLARGRREELRRLEDELRHMASGTWGTR